MLECKLGPGGNSIRCGGSVGDVAVDVAYMVGRLYGIIGQQNADAAKEFRRSVCTLLEPDSPTWGMGADGGVGVCIVMPGGKEEGA